MNTAQVIDNIRQVASTVLPQGSKLYLYGSRARGDAHEDIIQHSNESILCPIRNNNIL